MSYGACLQLETDLELELKQKTIPLMSTVVAIVVKIRVQTSEME